MSTSITYPKLQLFIAGEWIDQGSRDSIPVENPATGDILGQLPVATTADLDRALAAAKTGFKVWKDMLPEQRSDILRKAAHLMQESSEELATVACMESGKPIAQCRIEVSMSVHIFEWYAEEGRRAYGRVLTQRQPGSRMLVIKEPIGPVAGFAPWNFPMGNPARKLGAPLGAGCSAILKPAEETPGAALIMARCLQEAGVPDGVFSVVFGVPGEISSYLIDSPIIRKITFTGSVPVGKLLMEQASSSMKRSTMELGGHAPVLVFEDANLDSVLDMAVTSKYRNGGQVCVSPTRFYVHHSLYEAFRQGFAERAAAIKVGNPLDGGNQMGPMIHARRRSAVAALIDEAVRDGATLHTGGECIDGPGYFYKPTVLSDVPETSRIMNEEPFGPVALINPFSDFDEVIEKANRLSYGLAAYAFTNDAKRIMLLGEQLEAGMIGLNSFVISVPESPFGGCKDSGHGSEEGIEGLEACLITKFISQV